MEKWFATIGTSASGATKDLNLYLEQIGKIEQAEMVRAFPFVNNCEHMCVSAGEQSQHIIDSFFERQRSYLALHAAIPYAVVKFVVGFVFLNSHKGDGFRLASLPDLFSRAFWLDYLLKGCTVPRSKARTSNLCTRAGIDQHTCFCFWFLLLIVSRAEIKSTAFIKVYISVIPIPSILSSRLSV